MDLYIFLLLLGVLITFLFIILLMLFTTTGSEPNFHRYDGEFYFKNVKKGDIAVKCPSINDDPSVYLSVVIPAYNEENRLSNMLKEAFEYLEKRVKQDKTFTYEVIVVDDGSSDKTTDCALEFTLLYGIDKMRVLSLTKNRGKGGAVRLGVFSSRGKAILFADADGATKFSDFEKLENVLNKVTSDFAIVCGSRAHLQDDSVAKRSLFRTFLMHGFHFLVWFFCVKGIKDTQCGFKLITRKACFYTFSNLHVERWAFDVELLYIAQCLSITMKEVSVNWQEIEGSKMTPFWSWCQMGKDLVMIRLRYMTGTWKIQEKIKKN